MINSSYGKKGGIGPTAGKVSATYEGHLPDGRRIRKRSFIINAPDAFISYYKSKSNGQWIVAGVVSDKILDRGDQQFTPAKRIK